MGIKPDLVVGDYGGTGVLTGGVLSTGTASTEYSISDGTGQIVTAAGVTTDVPWSGKADIAPANLLTHLITWVAINSSGVVVEQVTAFTNLQARTLIILGVVVHVNKTTVDAVNNEQHVAYNTNSQLYDLMAAVGFFNVSGNVLSANGANLNINKSAGTMWAGGANYANDTDDPHPIVLAALTAATFQYRFSNGDNGTTGTAFDPANLDDGAGGLTAISGNNKWAITRAYSFTSNNLKLQRGISEYGTKDKAIAGIASEAFITEPSIAANGLFRGWIVHRKGATDLSDSTDAIFIDAPRFSAGTGGVGSIAETLQDVYDNSTDPEIIVNSTLGALSIQDASSPIGANLLEVQANGGGTDYLAVTASGIAVAGTMASTGAASASNLSGTNTGDSATDLSNTPAATTVTVESSDGLNTVLPQAIAAGNAGMMSGADKTVVDATSGTNTGDEPSATTSVQGIVRLATQAETDAGNAADRAVTPLSLATIQGEVDVNTIHAAASHADVDATKEYFSTFWAEENAVLSAATYEWAYGNGASTPLGSGIIVFVPSGYSAEIVAMGISFGGTSTATVEAVINNTPQGASAQVVCSAARTANGSGFTAAVSDGNVVNFRTLTVSGTTISPAIVSMTLRFYK